MSNEKKATGATTKDKIVDLLEGGDAFLSLSDLEAIKQVLDSRIDLLKPEPKVEDYWKETEVPLKFGWEVDGKPGPAFVRLKTPTGFDSSWFARQTSIDGEGRMVLTEEKSLIDFQAKCAAQLSAYSLDDICGLQGPDFEQVCAAAFDFFTDPAALMIWQDATT